MRTTLLAGFLAGSLIAGCSAASPAAPAPSATTPAASSGSASVQPTQAPTPAPSSTPTPTEAASPSTAASPEEPDIDLEGLVVAGPQPVRDKKVAGKTTNCGVDAPFFQNTRLDAAAVVTYTLVDQDGKRVSFFTPLQRDEWFVPPGNISCTFFRWTKGVETVAPVVSAVRWLAAPKPVAYQSVFYRTFAKDCQAEGLRIRGCRLTNKNKYPVVVRPYIGYLNPDGSLAELRAAGSAQTIPSGKGTLKFDNNAVWADQWADKKEGRSVLPMLFLDVDQPAFVPED